AAVGPGENGASAHVLDSAGAADAEGQSAATAGTRGEHNNRLVWRGQSGHYEVWFLTVYDPATRTGYWLRYTLESPVAGHGAPYVELWFARGVGSDPQRNFGIHRRFPIASFTSAQSPFRLQIGDSELGHDHARGGLSGAGHEIKWDLSWKPAP